MALSLDGLIGLFDLVAPVTLVFARVAALFSTMPGLGGAYIPVRVKAFLAVAITLVLAPQVGLQPGVAGIGFIPGLIREVFVGISLGFMIHLMFLAVRFGADLVGRTAGFAMAEVFDPGSEVTSGPLGDLFYTAMMLLFFLTNTHHHVLAALAGSYQMIPLGQAVVTPALGAAVVEAGNLVFIVAIGMAFPLLLALTAVTVVDGVVARAVPQINILHITFATKIMLTLGLLWLGIPAAVAFMGVVLALAMDVGHGVLQALAPG